jgi:hypothetical protein
MTMSKWGYLGINHHAIGPPPNWRDFISKKGKVKIAKYIAAVEDWILEDHEWDVKRITELDEERQNTGEMCEQLEQKLATLIKFMEGVKRTTTKRADEWRLTRDEYNKKYEEPDGS